MHSLLSARLSPLPFVFICPFHWITLPLPDTLLCNDRLNIMSSISSFPSPSVFLSDEIASFLYLTALLFLFPVSSCFSLRSFAALITATGCALFCVHSPPSPSSLLAWLCVCVGGWVGGWVVGGCVSACPPLPVSLCLVATHSHCAVLLSLPIVSSLLSVSVIPCPLSSLNRLRMKFDWFHVVHQAASWLMESRCSSAFFSLSFSFSFSFSCLLV